MIQPPVHIIGAGLAGSEAAWTVAQAGVPVVLHEMRPHRLTPAHKTDGFAELVCSNSFRSDDCRANAVGLLHEELRRMGSIIMRCGDDNQVPAGGALAVDRDHFSAAVTRAVSAHPLITTAREEITALPCASWDSVIVATGPLTGPSLAQAIQALTGEGELAFFDAIAPIVYRHSIDFDTAWMQSRYDKPGPAGDKAAYVNCPLNKPQYEAFIAALLEAPKTEFKDWEKDTPYFEGCLPIEVMAARGLDTLRFGPMKPIGLTDPRTGKGPYAVVQLRQDNALGTLFNMVGFQTKLKHAAQAELLRMIPGLEQAVFARLGGIHRNTFLNSPKLLNPTLQLKAQPRLRFAGQITGCEGYVESAAIGLLAGLFAARERLGLTTSLPPPTTALGALLAHVTGGHLSGGDLKGGELTGEAPIGPQKTSAGTFQPMNINFGLFPPLEDESSLRGPNGKRLRGADKARARKASLSDRALADLSAWRAGL